ncbi:MAG: L-threonylcarbamoyladenylate synthase [archaeon]
MNRIIKVGKNKGIPKKHLLEIVGMLKKGASIIYPTETSYGMGCSIKSRKEIEKIYSLKGREKEKDFVVLFSGKEMARKYGVISKEAEKLMEKFMPGALNLVVGKKKGKGNICFRIPKHRIAFDLVKGLGEGLISTSCNKSGGEPIYSGKKAIKAFGGKIDIIVDCGIIPKRKPSTIFDVKNKKVLRKGEISEREILNVLDEKK